MNVYLVFIFFNYMYSQKYEFARTSAVHLLLSQTSHPILKHKILRYSQDRQGRTNSLRTIRGGSIILRENNWFNFIYFHDDR